jgi:predicted RND superfamily exporter protein
MGAVDRRPALILAATLVVTVVLAVYAALYLGVDADPRELINPRLPFQVRQREVSAAFHTMNDGFLVVIDADSPSS